MSQRPFSRADFKQTKRQQRRGSYLRGKTYRVRVHSSASALETGPRYIYRRGRARSTALEIFSSRLMILNRFSSSRSSAVACHSRWNRVEKTIISAISFITAKTERGYIWYFRHFYRFYSSGCGTCSLKADQVTILMLQKRSWSF